MDVFMKVRAAERISRQHSRRDSWIHDKCLPVIKQWEKVGEVTHGQVTGGSMADCYPC